jgi:hypothetical protein
VTTRISKSSASSANPVGCFFTTRGNSFPLSPGERAGVRASVDHPEGKSSLRLALKSFPAQGVTARKNLFVPTSGAGSLITTGPL